MDAIFLDNSFKMSRVVDAYTSFIWKDRYIGYGDFELRFPMIDGALAGIEIGSYLTNKESDRYMVVEGIEMITSVEDGNTATITGRSLESLLDRRIVLEQCVLTGSLQDGILRLLNANLINPVDPMRKISKFWFKASDDKNILSIQIDVVVEKGKNLYNAIYDICYEKHVGFRCIPIDSDGTIMFELYYGEDRSYSQTRNPWVVFSPKFENIQATDMRINTENLRNVMYAESTYTERVEDIDGNYTEEERTISVQINDGDYSGLDRREMYATSGEMPERISISDFGEPEDRVDLYRYAIYTWTNFHEAEYERDYETYNRWLAENGASNPDDLYDPRNQYTPPRIENYYDWDWVIVLEDEYKEALARAAAEIDAEYKEALGNAANVTENLIREAASEELSNWMKISEFDGEVAPKFQYILGEHYNLGDIVQIVNEYGFQAVTRVTSILYSEEAGTGFMMRPEFTSDNKAVFEL